MEHTERTKAEQIANAYFDMGAGWAESGGLLRDLREMEQGYLKRLADAQATVAALQRERDALKTEVYDQKKLADKYWKEAREADNKRVESETALDAERERMGSNIREEDIGKSMMRSKGGDGE